MRIGDLLSKFKKLIGQNEAIYTTISAILTKHLSLQIDQSKIKIKGTTIFINSFPILKSEILIHKKGILEDIKALLPENNFTDIR